MENENRLKLWGFGYLLLFLVVLVVTFVATGHCQVSVSIAPPMFPQFEDANGKPLAGGFLYTYSSGTTTLLPTYVDFAGTIQNPDPIPLDATGAPSNGSVQTGIWLANQSYKFCLYSSALVLQGCKDNITGYLNLLNLANTWTFQQTFTQPILDTQTDNQLVFGAPGNQTTLDFPPPTGNITLHFPNIAGTILTTGGNNTLTGSNTFTGPVLVKSLNNTQMCDQFSGGTADLQLIACIAALTNGGTADARGLIGTQTIASEVDIGNSTSKFINLILPCGAIWNVTINNAGASALKVFGGSSITSNCAQNNAMKLALAAAGSVASLVTNDQACANCSVKISGLMLYNTLGGTVANAMLDLSNLGNNAEISSVNIATFKTKGLWIHGANSESVFTAVNVDGGQTTGAVPCTIETTSPSLETLRFFGLDCQHPGGGNNLLVINGHGGTSLNDLTFVGSHFEGSSSDTTTPFISIADAKNIAFYSPFWNSLDSGTTNYGIQFSQTAANLTDAITVINATHGNGNFINDTIRSKLVTGGGILPFYSYVAANTTVPSMFVNGTTMTEIAAPTIANTGGVDTCYADSISHTPKCQYNGGNFHKAMPLYELGNCTMSAGTTCTASIPSGFSSYFCLTGLNNTAVVESGFCTLSGTTVTVTATTNNSAIWNFLIIGTPN